MTSSSSIAVLGSPIFQAFYPGTSNPLVGGKLYTLIPGGDLSSLTPSYKTVTDARNQTNANTNPIILDANGSAPVVILGAAKLVLQDVNSNQEWSFDNYNLSSSNIYDNNGNPLLLFNSNNGAVNEITISNAVAGSAPVIAATGSDAIVGMSVNLTGNATLALNTGVTGTTAMQGNATVGGTLSAQSSNGGFNLIPAGMYGWFALTSAPTGWIQCNGAAVSRTTYSVLFAAIGTTYGSGDGTTTFNVPSAARSTLVASGGSGTAVLGNAVSNTGGAESVAIVKANYTADVVIVNSTVATGAATLSGSTIGVPTISTGTFTNGGPPTAMNNMQPSLVALLCIKA